MGAIKLIQCRHYPHLRSLDLEVLSISEIHTISDQFLNGLFTACRQSLKELDFVNCSKLTGYSLKTIGKSYADLCPLNISDKNNLTDLGLEYLANGCSSIQKAQTSPQ
ncbi:hypothetical protein OROGR_007477 [Orobanche gracilis]